MTGWIIAACVLAVLIVPLWIPLTCRVEYHEKKASASLKYLFFTVPLYPREQKKKKKGGQKKKVQKTGGEKPSGLMKMMKEDGLSGVLDFITHLSKSGKRLLKKVLAHTKVKDFRLVLIIAGEDAADAALRYGKTCMVFYPMFSYLCTIVRITVKELSVLPSFDAEESKEEFSFRAKTLPAFLLSAAIGFFLRFFAHTIKKQFRKQKDFPVHETTKAV